MASLAATLSSAKLLWSPCCSPPSPPPSVEAKRARSPSGVRTEAEAAEPKDSRPRLPVVAPPPIVMMDEAEE